MISCPRCGFEAKDGFGLRMHWKQLNDHLDKNFPEQIDTSRLPITKETRKKISETLKGRSLTEEHRQAMIEGLTGISRGPRSKETKKKISRSLEGRTLSEEHKRKISEARTGVPRSEKTKRSMSEARRGIPLSKEHVESLSKAWTARNLSLNCSFRSSWERNVAGYLETLDVVWKHEPRAFETASGTVIPDFIVNDVCLVEVKGDGPFEYSQQASKYECLIEDWIVVLVSIDKMKTIYPHDYYVEYGSYMNLDFLEEIL